MASLTPEHKNPGPSGSLALMSLGVRLFPDCIVAIAGRIGTCIAYLTMPEQKHWSRSYLTALHGSPPGRREVWRHFQAFTESLITKVRAGTGRPVQAIINEPDRPNLAILFSDEPLILGTFHVGASDLLGFHISETGRHVSMVRTKVRNSGDIDSLSQRYRDRVHFIWVNNPDEMLLSLRDALSSTTTLAMQCDRPEGAHEGEPFQFLGQQRLFRTSIYRLARLYQRKVLFCLALPGEKPHQFRVLAHLPFDGSGLDRKSHQQAAHAHFQSVLNWLEALLRDNPYQWFNFLPLNPSPGSPPHKDVA